MGARGARGRGGHCKCKYSKKGGDRPAKRKKTAKGGKKRKKETNRKEKVSDEKGG